MKPKKPLDDAWGEPPNNLSRGVPIPDSAVGGMHVVSSFSTRDGYAPMIQVSSMITASDTLDGILWQ